MRRAVFLLAALAGLVGCSSYQSSYVPPADGRARPIFQDTKVVMSADAANDRCLTTVATPGSWAPSGERSHGWGGGPIIVFWAPVPGPVMHVHSAPRPIPSSRVHGGGGFFSGGAMGGGKGGNGNKDAMQAVAVVAILALPFVAYGLALGRAEPEEEVADAVDRVNWFNDLARTPGSPCYEGP